MKKIIFTLIGLTLGFGAFAQSLIQMNTEVATLSEESQAVINMFTTHADFHAALADGKITEKTVSWEQIKKLFAEIKGKRVEGYNWINNYLYDVSFQDENLKTLSKEEAIEAFRSTYCTAILIGNGIINLNNYTESRIAVNAKEVVRGISTRWQFSQLARMNNVKLADVQTGFYKSRLGKGIFNEQYQKWFVDYVRNLPLAEAKTIISTELRMIVGKVDPANKKQNDWLTQLRVLNTTYSEL